MSKETRVLSDNCINYTDDYETAKKLNYHTMFYTWRHIPSGKHGIKSVFIERKRNAQRLIDYWNRTEDWQYALQCI